jgi:hypothetical protein
MEDPMQRWSILIAGLICTAAPVWADELATWRGEVQPVAQELIKRLSGELKQALEAGGPSHAISVCTQVAPAIARELSLRTGWQVHRVSLKVRNPLLGTPDAWEQQALQQLETRLAAGEKAETLEVAQVVDEPTGRFFRYLKALPVGAPCLNCHGEAIKPEVAAALREHYPADRATGYREGQIRGAVSIKRPLF